MPEQIPPVIRYAKVGTAIFDVQAAAAAQERELREWQRAVADLQQLGMQKGKLVVTPSPRATVEPPVMVPPGLGDIHSPISEPGQRYYQTLPQPRAALPVPAVSGRAFPLPAEAEPYRGLLDYVFGSVLERFKQGPLFCQPMTWLAPPITAISVDLFTNANGVTLPGGYPGPGTCVNVLSIDVPDRWIFVLDRFGNELDDHTAFGDVRFSMQRNRTPLRSYGDFDCQLGRFVNPTKFGSPIILKHKDEFRLQAQSLSMTDHTAYARLMGWAFAVRTISGSGDYSEFFAE